MTTLYIYQSSVLIISFLAHLPLHVSVYFELLFCFVHLFAYFFLVFISFVISHLRFYTMCVNSDSWILRLHLNRVRTCTHTLSRPRTRMNWCALDNAYGIDWIDECLNNTTCKWYKSIFVCATSRERKTIMIQEKLDNIFLKDRSHRGHLLALHFWNYIWLNILEFLYFFD